MPQLDIHPWYNILIWTWITFSIFTPLLTSKFGHTKAPRRKFTYYTMPLSRSAPRFNWYKQIKWTRSS